MVGWGKDVDYARTTVLASWQLAQATPRLGVPLVCDKVSGVLIDQPEETVNCCIDITAY